MLGLLSIFFLPFAPADFVTESSDGASYFNPPIINVASPETDVPSNSSIELQCAGNYPLAWRIPEMWAENISERLSNKSYFDENRIINKYYSELRVTNAEYLDTGRYVCYYNVSGGERQFSPENSTSIYVFVNDEEEIFVPSRKFGHILFTVVSPSKPTRVECLPTNSRTNVTLWKIKNDDEAEQVFEGNDVLYDPTQGFILLYPNIYFTGLFQCRGVLGRKTGQINITFFYLSDSQHSPQPIIDLTRAKYPVVNGSFTLLCSVKIEPSTMVHMEWSYPNKGTPRIIETNATMREQKNSRNYVFREVTQELIVTESTLSDTGTYTCTVTDHSGKHNYHDVFIGVHAKTQTHINFTTDIDLTKPMVRQVGDHVKIVMTVSAYPDLDAVQMFWEKDGKLLKTGPRHQVKNTTTQVILLITQLERSDAGNYTLFGKTDELLMNISLQLLVKALPSVNILKRQNYYHVHDVYKFTCQVEGYPLPKVWWKWKPCNDPNVCDPESLFGWIDVEPDRYVVNNETLSEKEFKGVDTILYNLTVHAIQSGYYMCSGTNDLGFHHDKVAFIVTDAKEGFEVSASNLEPVDEDEVWLTCRASIFNYSKVLWSWKPSNDEEPFPVVDTDSQISLISLTTPYSHSVTLSFSPISTNNSGLYLCSAWNLDVSYHSQEALNVTVKAIEVPSVIKTNMEGRTVDIEPAEQFKFVCEVDGTPKPTITWYKDDLPYDVSNMSGVEFMDDNQSLAIKRVVDTDSGIYKCLAENRGGVVALFSTLNVIKDDLPPQNTTTLIAIICTVVVFSIILGVVAVILLKKICKERKEKQEMEFFSHALFNRGQIEMFNPDLCLDDQVDLLPYDQKWEFPKERLKLGKTLGQGAFGRVVKADAIGLDDGETKTIVAVKMLKERADGAQRKALMAELKILIHLGSHLNIVNLLGAVTKNLAKGELMVIMEYCCHGNMRNYLLRHRTYFSDQINIVTGEIDPNIVNLLGTPSEEKDCPFSSDNGWSNPTYGQKVMNYADILHGSGNYSGPAPQDSEPTSPTTPKSFYPTNTGETMKKVCCQLGKFSRHVVSTCDLMCYAFQCARGMEYLATRKLIHRDLAARNVLLAEDNIVKICDFGLAKDCYKYSNYVKKGDGPLPIKWMAVESIGDKLFTTKSDVWSFGVLLWEIFTLGGNPYPGIEIDENFYKKLKSGYQMEKPQYAPSDLYQIMTNCWKTDPELRPSFTELADKIGDLLEAGVRKYYMELNSPYAEINSQLRSDYLSMSSTDYLNMGTEPTVDLQLHYDNISSVRPVGDGPVPTEPMEVVPMIHFDTICENWPKVAKKDLDSGPNSPTSSVDHSDYLIMGSTTGSEKTDLNRTRKGNESVRSDTSSGFHSDAGNTDENHSSPPPYRFIVEDRREAVDV